MDHASKAEVSDELDYMALQEQGQLPSIPISSLYSGTYGQVVEALASVDLVAISCEESGFPNGNAFTSLCNIRKSNEIGWYSSQRHAWVRCLSPGIHRQAQLE